MEERRTGSSERENPSSGNHHIVWRLRVSPSPRLRFNLSCQSPFQIRSLDVEVVDLSPEESSQPQAEHYHISDGCFKICVQP